MRSLLFWICLFIAIPSFSQSASVGIGTTTPSQGAALDVQSTNKGLLIPRLSAAAINSITGAEVGTMVFNTDSGKFYGLSGYNSIPIMQAGPNNSLATTPPGPSGAIGQSFTMPGNAYIQSIDVTVGPAAGTNFYQVLSMTIVDGEGFGGNVIATATNTFNLTIGAVQPRRFTFASTPLLPAGHKYTFVLQYQTSGAAGSLRVYNVSNGTYAGGTAYDASGVSTGGDLVFSVNTPAPVWRPLQVQ